MNTAPLAVTQTVTLELVDATGAAAPLDAELRYDVTDPFAVTAVFHTTTTDVTWTFGRDLLAEGLYEPAGDGDVHVWPCLDPDGHAVVIVELCSPDGEALLQAKSDDIAGFVAASHKAIAPGREGRYLDIDGTIHAILTAEAV